MRSILFFISYFLFSTAGAQSLTLVELNCENLFDCKHDSLKQDQEWLPASVRKWTPTRYWRKVNNIGQTILSCQTDGVPDLVALVEVENDSVVFDLTRRSLLRNAGYEYLMTQPLEGMRPTRDILYIKGETLSYDTLHVFVVHAPSRFGGERATRPNRRIVAERLMSVISTLPTDAKVIVAGDFNDYADSPALQYLSSSELHNVTALAQGTHGAQGTYRYQGRWQSIDHVLVSSSLLHRVAQTYINDAPFLLEEDKKYGGVKPLRTFNGYRYQRGFSDHLPLVVHFR